MKRVCVPAAGHTATPAAINDIRVYSFIDRHKIIMSMGFAH